MPVLHPAPKEARRPANRTSTVDAMMVAIRHATKGDEADTLFHGAIYQASVAWVGMKIPSTCSI
jgi:hypothetical protein